MYGSGTIRGDSHMKQQSSLNELDIGWGRSACGSADWEQRGKTLLQRSRRLDLIIDLWLGTHVSIWKSKKVDLNGIC